MLRNLGSAHNGYKCAFFYFERFYDFFKFV